MHPRTYNVRTFLLRERFLCQKQQSIVKSLSIKKDRTCKKNSTEYFECWGWVKGIYEVYIPPE